MDSHKVNTNNTQPLNLQLPAGPSSSAGTLYCIQLNDTSVDQPQSIFVNVVTGNQNDITLAPTMLPARSQQPMIASILPAPRRQRSIPSILPSTSKKPIIASILPAPSRQHIIFANEPPAPLLANVAKEASKLKKNKDQNVKTIQNSKVPKFKRKQKLHKARVKSSMLLNDYGVIKKLTHSEANKLVLEALAAKEPIFLKKGDFSFVSHIDVSDKDKSNWLGLLPLGDSKTANVWLYEVSGELYGVTTHELFVGTPLTIGYTRQYFEEHELPDSMPVLCLDNQPSKIPLKNWKCSQCSATLKSAAAIEIHIKNHATRKFLRVKSRCSYCKKVFSSKHSLKRHIQLKQCVMLKSKTNGEPSTSLTLQKPATGTPINRSLCPTPVNEEHMNQKLTGTPINRSLCPTPINEESRLPSDESLQNYTNGLDISTNLFGPNLDTSASELNPYSLLPLGYKEGNELGAAGEYARFSRELMDNMDVCNDDEVSKVKQKTDGDHSIICSHCNESVLKSKHKQHFRKCISQRIVCICGKIYFKMETYHRHWQEKCKDIKHENIEHDIDPETQQLNSDDETKQKPLKCEVCDLNFKRRGMLVNHMWTKHRKKSSVPVEKRIKLYPCVACPVVYRTAAKRKRHVLAYHPGIEIETCKYAIETERRAVSPATCPECPREYASQAKLNQHIRAVHPEIQHEIKKIINVKSEQSSVNFTGLYRPTTPTSSGIES